MTGLDSGRPDVTGQRSPDHGRRLAEYFHLWRNIRQFNEENKKTFQMKKDKDKFNEARLLFLIIKKQTRFTFEVKKEKRQF